MHIWTFQNSPALFNVLKNVFSIVDLPREQEGKIFGALFRCYWCNAIYTASIFLDPKTFLRPETAVEISYILFRIFFQRFEMFLSFTFRCSPEVNTFFKFFYLCSVYILCSIPKNVGLCRMHDVCARSMTWHDARSNIHDTEE